MKNQSNTNTKLHNYERFLLTKHTIYGKSKTKKTIASLLVCRNLLINFNRVGFLKSTPTYTILSDRSF
jgi:hypothetical protein